MADQVEGKWVVPNPQVPRTFGMLNIIFGILLLLFGVYTIVMTVYGPRIQGAVINQMKVQQAEQKSEQDAKIADLKKKEAAAKTKEDKEAIIEEREALERRSAPDVSAMMSDAMGMANDRRIIIYTYAETITGILLNVLMVISGAGLLRISEWGRRLAISVAWLKILRWITIMAFTMVVIVPITTEVSQKMFHELEKQIKTQSGRGATPFPMASMAQFAAIATAATSVVSALFASIYPAFPSGF